MMQVIKRDGSQVEYNESKVALAVIRAAGDDTEYTATKARLIAQSITLMLDGDGSITVEGIQDLVESKLIDEHMNDVAKTYIIYRHERNKSREERHEADNSAIQDYVFTSRYSRYLDTEARRETFDESVDRVRDMHLKKYCYRGEKDFAEEDYLPIFQTIAKAFSYVKEKRCLPSMRSMQFGGKAIEVNHGRMYNCAFGICDRLDFFHEGMFLLLCGTGVGLSVEFEHTSKLPVMTDKIDETSVVHHHVPDTLEGWADAVKALVQSYLTGDLIEFNYSAIRPRGERLKTSGGTAPGHVPLRRAIENARKILDRTLGRKIKSIEAYDIFMHLADAVIAGGVRRSATICLFSPDDDEMMSAKTGNWFEENPQRGRSNNSAKLIRGEATQPQFERLFNKQKEWGEPGFYFADHINHGANPCVEIGLNPVLEHEDGTSETGWQFCNLTEINGAMLKSREDFRKATWAATIIGTLQAGYTDFPYLGNVTEELCKKEALLGVSITGMMDNPHIALDPELQKEMAKYALEVNKEFAELIGINEAARVTCVKPAGSTSLLLGTASGIHPRHARRYFRRIQANKADNVYKYFNSKNPHMCEESVWSANRTDDVITFCVQSDDKAITKAEVGAIDLLKYVLSTQQNWVENGNGNEKHNKGLRHNVSNTISVKDNEWDSVMNFIWEHKEHFTGISMLPASGDKMYAQAPHEELVGEEDEVKWNTLNETYRKVVYTNMQENKDNTTLQAEIACAGGACEL